MGTRGRQSGASMAVAALSVITVARPDAPYDLDDPRAVEEWQAVVNRMPADWFPRETHGNLANYCTHIADGWYIRKLIQDALKADPVDLEKLDKLLKMQERESRAAASLATRLRITQQSLFDKEKKRPVQVPKPWE
jgi:hypothetical protein